MQILSNVTTGRVSQKVTEPLKNLEFTVVVTGDFQTGNPDLLAAFNNNVSNILLTVTRRLSNGKTRDIVQQRPLNELLEQMAMFSDDVIEITTQGTASMTIVGKLPLGGVHSIQGNSASYPEITVAIANGVNNLNVSVTGDRDHVQRDGNLFYDTISTLANQASEFPIEKEMVHIAVPNTLTNLRLKHSTNVDVEYTYQELVNKFKNNNGACYLVNGLIKWSSNWIVIPFIPAEFAQDFGGFTTAVRVLTSNSATLYVLKKY